MHKYRNAGQSIGLMVGLMCGGFLGVLAGEAIGLLALNPVLIIFLSFAVGCGCAFVGATIGALIGALLGSLIDSCMASKKKNYFYAESASTTNNGYMTHYGQRHTGWSDDRAPVVQPSAPPCSAPAPVERRSGWGDDNIQLGQPVDPRPRGFFQR